MSTIPGLFGAMSGDDLNTIEIGLLPKMNHERVAVSEFQTWGDETFGELMNMMANGKIEMQKGALDVVRETNLNLLFMGNPPHYYDEDKHDKKSDVRCIWPIYLSNYFSTDFDIYSTLIIRGFSN